MLLYTYRDSAVQEKRTVVLISFNTFTLSTNVNAFQSKCLSRKKCGFTEILALLNLSQNIEQVCLSKIGKLKKNTYIYFF
jgi:hypothetical protein